MWYIVYSEFAIGDSKVQLTDREFLLDTIERALKLSPTGRVIIEKKDNALC